LPHFRSRFATNRTFDRHISGLRCIPWGSSPQPGAALNGCQQTKRDLPWPPINHSATLTSLTVQRRVIKETEMRQDLIIEATEMRKTYVTGSLQVDALRGVDFAVAPGEMVAIMGPSGSGKTTMLNCLSGLDEFEGGDVRIAGVSLRDMSDNEKTEYRATRMGFVFQVYNLLPVLSAVENVELPLLVGGVRPGQARKRALAALDSVNLGDRAKHRPSELSGGQAQRVAVARALVNNADAEHAHRHRRVHGR
jgi:putative ABC transport system ATP-binding protein